MNTTILTTKTNKSDIVGMLASGLCMIHCLATPLIFVVQVSATCYEKGPWWWKMIDYAFLVISIIAIYYSAKKTSLQWMPTALYACWGCLAILIINEGLHLVALPHMLIYLPAFSLIFLHLYNRRYCGCTTDECAIEK
jgi:hypothetical protein